MISFPNVAVNLKKLMPDEVAIQLQTYRSAKVANEYDKQRYVRNVMAYCGLDADQYSIELAAELIRNGRLPKTYNFLQMYVDGVAGNFLMNWVDPKFVDREDDDKDVQEAVDGLQKIYFSDKEHFDYKASVTSSLVNGCIGMGVEELSIVRSTQEPLGRLKFESIRPDLIIMDQSNFSDEIGRKAQRAHKRFHLTPDEMMFYYPHMETEIKDHIRALKDTDKKCGEDFERTQVGSFGGDQQKYGNKYEVVEYYHVDYERKNVAIDIMSQTTLPETAFEFGSEEDYMAKKAWSESKGRPLLPNYITVQSKPVATLYVTTFCSELALILENRKDERQLVTDDGMCHLPFYVWAFIQKNGKCVGLVDIGFDAQQDLNKRDMQKTKILTETPIGGISWMHPLAFGDGADKRKQWIADFNDSSKPKVLDEAAPPGVDLFGVKAGNQLPQGLFQEENVKLDFMNKQLRLPPAMQGQLGKSGQSGVLHARQVIEATIMHKVPATTIMMNENYKAEDWVRLGIKLYGGRNQAEKLANLNRTFNQKDGPPITVNKHVGNDDEGNPIVVADISKLKRVDIIISQDKESDYAKQAKQETSIATLNAIPPTETNALKRVVIENQLVMASDVGNDAEAKEQMQIACKKTYELELKRNEILIKQADAQLAQMNQPEQQGPVGPPQGPEGVPGMAGPEMGAPQAPGAGPEANGGALAAERMAPPPQVAG